MHFLYKISSPSKLKQGIFVLKSLGLKEVYTLEEGGKVLIGGFSDQELKVPSFLKLILKEAETINWAQDWEKETLEIPIGSTSFFLKAGPGFGDARHPTTLLCLKALEKLHPQAVLDIGSGSGILSIGAQKLGVKNVISIEIDDPSISHHRENIALNHLEENLIKKTIDSSDLTVNDQLILMNMITSEQAQIFAYTPELLKVKKKWVVSGILSEAIEEAIAKYKELGFEILAIDQLEKWVAITMEKS
ncbi:MAG: hypothetical protein EBU93_00095 [Chlamydiae bacterium]|nr:hypothetical protein [Chlamydiota bacterium]